MRVAAANWLIRPIQREEEFFEHLESFVQHASSQEVEHLTLPELPVLELLELEPGLPPSDAPRFLAQFAAAYEAQVYKLAKDHSLAICAGSHFRPRDGIENTSLTVFADGSATFQPKVKLTTYEKEVWKLTPGAGLSIEHPSSVPTGTTICYDAEFPESGRKLAEAGVLVQCVPAFTETQRGFQRVRWCCQARAVENQVFVVHASLVGSLGREPVPTTHGSSAVLAPSIEPFPESAVLAESALGVEALAIADLDFDLLHLARRQGDVRNWEDRSPEW